MPVLRVPTQYAMSTIRERDSRESKRPCEMVVLVATTPLTRSKLARIRIVAKGYSYVWDGAEMGPDIAHEGWRCGSMVGGNCWTRLLPEEVGLK